MASDFSPTMGLYTIAEVAEMLKISESTVRRFQQQRVIPFRKVGGRVRFTTGDIESYVESIGVKSIG